MKKFLLTLGKLQNLYDTLVSNMTDKQKQALTARYEEINSARRQGCYVAAPITKQFAPDVGRAIILIKTYDEYRLLKQKEGKRYEYYNPIGK
jgi:hypothetical protein